MRRAARGSHCILAAFKRFEALQASFIFESGHGSGFYRLRRHKAQARFCKTKNIKGRPVYLGGLELLRGSPISVRHGAKSDRAITPKRRINGLRNRIALKENLL
jgi:hypothetical protein